MSLVSYLEQQIDQEILEEYNLYSVDSMSPNQLDWARQQYYRALWNILRREMEGYEYIQMQWWWGQADCSNHRQGCCLHSPGDGLDFHASRNH